MEKNKITIITVVKNSSNTIEKTIKSVLDQGYENLEYIIIDGKSNDGTLSKIEKYKKNISVIISEKDGGIWDAMNKGIKLSKGDIIGFLNSGDVYFPGVLNLVNNYFLKNNLDFLFGTVEKYKLMHGYSPWKVSWSFGFYTSHSIGFFIKRKRHLEIGFYDESFLSADLDFFYKMIKNFKLKGKSSKKDEIFGKFESGGFSSKVNYIDHLKDLNQIRIKNNQNMIFVYLLFVLKIIKKPIKFLKALNMS
tara:strand:- start:255 stop:1001 length:747 start_codon:yes stop_codon:yes gene_type:complete